MALKIKGFVAFAATGILGLGMLVGGPAASAADLGTMVIDCNDGTTFPIPSPYNVSGTVGDTFAIQDDDDGDGDCTSFQASPSGIVTWSATPGGTDNPSTLPDDGTFYVTLLQPGTTTVRYVVANPEEGDPSNLSFTITVSEGTSSGGSSGPVMQLQQLPIPASGNCADADPNNALWAQPNTTPWTLQWGEWSEPVPFSGFVCGRWVWAYGAP